MLFRSQSTFGDFLLSDMLEEFPDTLPSPEVTLCLGSLVCVCVWGGGVDKKKTKNRQQTAITFAPRLETSTELSFDCFLEKMVLLRSAQEMFFFFFLIEERNIHKIWWLLLITTQQNLESLGGLDCGYSCGRDCLACTN